MKDIFEIISAVLLSIGGGGAIVFALSSWLGKIWATRILEKEKNEYTKDIEKYKTQLEKEITNLNFNNEKAIFVTKLQYEKEFAIYLELWEDLSECTQRTLLLYPTLENMPSNEKEREKYQSEKYSSYVEAYNQYLKTMNKYAPFYNDSFDEVLEKIRYDCASIGSIFNAYNFEVKYSDSFAMVRDSKMTIEEHRDVYINLPKAIKSNLKKLKEEIRVYLKKLQVSQN